MEKKGMKEKINNGRNFFEREQMKTLKNNCYTQHNILG